MAGLELVSHKGTGTPYPAREKRGTRACLAARRHGALLRQLGDVVVILPPLCVTTDEIDRLAAAAEAGIREATAD
jgi:adenosylmethionine-8-amino-7-oxononanoate aminotransferase